jgi:hypothetical protein
MKDSDSWPHKFELLKWTIEYLKQQFEFLIIKIRDHVRCHNYGCVMLRTSNSGNQDLEFLKIQIFNKKVEYRTYKIANMKFW